MTNNIALLPPETILLSKRILVNRKWKENDEGVRIGKLITTQLTYITSALGASLYRDNNTGLAWEMGTYINVPGWGPSLLHAIPEKKVNYIYEGLKTPVEQEEVALRAYERGQRFINLSYTKDDFLLQDFETIISTASIIHLQNSAKVKRKRVAWLIEHHLEFIKNYGNDTLYFDKDNGLYWELVRFEYDSQALGGGYKTILPNPTILHCVDEVCAKLKYT
jgi:hypothetical protein